MIRVLYVLAIVVSAILALALYVAKTEAQSVQQRIARMERGIHGEQIQIIQLENELAFLERPERIAELAVVHLQLRPLTPEQDLSFAALGERLATDSGGSADGQRDQNAAAMKIGARR